MHERMITVNLLLIIVISSSSFAYPIKLKEIDATIHINDSSSRDTKIFQLFDDPTENDKFEVINLENDYAIISARGSIYNITIESLTENVNERVTWPCSDKSVLCLNKQFIVIEINSTHTIYCGFRDQSTYCDIKMKGNKHKLVKLNDDATRISVYAFDLVRTRSKGFNYHLTYSRSIAHSISDQELIIARTRVYTDSSEGSLPISKHIMNKNAQSTVIGLPPRAITGIPHFYRIIKNEDSIYFFYNAFLDNDNRYHGNLLKTREYNSYVGKICLNDNATDQNEKTESLHYYYGSRRTFVSFRQALFFCTVPIDTEFGVKYSKLAYSSELIDNEWVYAIFHSNSPLDSKSTICAYKINTIVENLDTAFQDLTIPLKCGDLNKTDINAISEYRQRLGIYNYKGIIKDAIDSEAIYFLKDYNLLSLAIDSTNTNFKIIYAGVDDGRVLKLVLDNHNKKPILVQQIILFNNLPVTHLKISYKNKKLVAFSNKMIKSVPLVFCYIYGTCSKCLLKRDPYCGWDINANKCIEMNYSNTNVRQYINEKSFDLNATCKSSLMTSTTGTTIGTIAATKINNDVNTTSNKYITVAIHHDDSKEDDDDFKFETSSVSTNQLINENQRKYDYNIFIVITLTVITTLAITVLVYLILVNRKKLLFWRTPDKKKYKYNVNNVNNEFKNQDFNLIDNKKKENVYVKASEISKSNESIDSVEDEINEIHEDDYEKHLNIEGISLDYNNNGSQSAHNDSRNYDTIRSKKKLMNALYYNS